MSIALAVTSGGDKVGDNLTVSLTGASATTKYLVYADWADGWRSETTVVTDGSGAATFHFTTHESGTHTIGCEVYDEVLAKNTQAAATTTKNTHSK